MMAVDLTRISSREAVNAITQRAKRFKNKVLRPLFSRLGEAIGYGLVRLLVATVQTLPVDMGDSICRGLARVVTSGLGIRRRITHDNLSQVFPHMTPQRRSELEFQMWHHLLLMVCEIAWAQRRLHRTNWAEHVRFRDNRKMLEYALSQRPTVMVTGHFGNFEVGGYVSGLMGLSTLTIARRLDNRYLHDWVERFRGAKGQYMVDKDGCATEVDQHLQEGGILSLLADQHAGPKGCWVDFMGVPASCHKALALFSLSSDAPMLVVGTRRINRQPMQFELACFGDIDPRDDSAESSSVTTMTEWYNEKLGEAIEESVEQYWWLHRRWRQPPPKVQKRLEKRRAA